MTNITGVFLDLLAKHDLHVVSVGINSHMPIGNIWAATVHWTGFSRDNIACAHGHAATPHEAIEAAIRRSVIDRTPSDDDVSVPVLEVDAA